MKPSSANVVLVHGLWNKSAWMQPLAHGLRKHGLVPTVFSYDTLWVGPEPAMPALLETLQRTQARYVVGHSLGGLLALETLRWAPDLAVDRVVCLGSPLLGSQTAHQMAHHPVKQWALGRSREWLLRGLSPWEGRAEVGVIAGTSPRGLGRWMATLEGSSDGTVLVEETRLQGICDHHELPLGHTELALSPRIVAPVARFLHQGRFQ